MKIEPEAEGTVTKSISENGWKVLQNMIRVIHLFSICYVLGQAFNIFIMGPADVLTDNQAEYVMDILFITLVIVTGLGQMGCVLKLAEGVEGRKTWVWINIWMMILTIFVTRLTDFLLFSWVAVKD